MQDNPFMSVTEAAQFYGVGADSVRRLVRSGQLPAFRLGGERGSIRILRADLQKALVAAAGSADGSK